ncbi:heat shock 70 kDa protein 12A-like isoform X2 [Mytilus edulis]|uniref:heat shock 70 kDa protein 12A-like isoform X2 n=1 Tax=Mytilus edulis TaxID=6550 RepID=UPI0039F09B80
MKLVIWTNYLQTTYIHRCSDSSQRRFRSKSVCIDKPEDYSCLFDTNKEYYTEYCDTYPDFSAPGEYYVFTGRRRNIECGNTTYQPYSLWSNESSTCTFKKSLCTESGQIQYKLSSSAEDIQCRCDYTKRYAFVFTPTHRCFCTPSEEDCSCYIKQCGFGYILNADYECKLKRIRSATKCEANEHLGTKGDNEMPKETYSDPSSYFQSDRNIIPLKLEIALVLIYLLVFCTKLIMYPWQCGIGNIWRMNQSDKHSYSDNTERETTQNIGDFKIVAAIDLGTTFSGYASSTREMFKANPLDITKNPRWIINGVKYISLKTDTCILMKKNGNCVALGDVAMDEYADLLQEDKANEYLFFHRFKMELYNKENISTEMVMKDVMGLEMKTIDVFSTFIYELMKRVKTEYEEIEFEDILWVLTVPAVWSSTAIHFMRQCAEKKGVRQDRLMIASEPEVVSVYFQYLHTFNPTGVPELDKRYLVVDIGGGTVDITAHEKTEGGNLIELCKRTGENMGATEIDKNFLDLLGEIVGEDVMKSLMTEDNYKDSYFDILREIENFKRTIFVSSNDNLFFKVPKSDLEILCKQYYDKSLMEKIASSKYAKELSMKKEKIVFHRSSLSFLFIPVVNKIIGKIAQVLEELKEFQINMIILAGGLSRSPSIGKKIVNKFKHMKIITTPEEYAADLAVVTGAVLYGHRPHFITSRITNFTYGRLVQKPFEIGKHKPAKRITIDGVDLCNDLFEVLIERDTTVMVNEKIQKEYKTTSTLQKQVRIAVYYTEKDKVDYVDDDGCRMLCEVMVPLGESKMAHQCVIVDFIFGYAEFQVKAFEKETGKYYEVTVELP